VSLQNSSEVLANGRYGIYEENFLKGGVFESLGNDEGYIHEIFSGDPFCDFSAIPPWHGAGP
jgi:hypothetical protein